MGSELFYAYGVDNLPWKRLETEHTNNFTSVPKKKELTIGTSSEELVYGNAHSDSRQSPKISSVIVAHKTNDCFKDNSCSTSNMTIDIWGQASFSIPANVSSGKRIGTRWLLPFPV